MGFLDLCQEETLSLPVPLCHHPSNEAMSPRDKLLQSRVEGDAKGEGREGKCSISEKTYFTI